MTPAHDAVFEGRLPLAVPNAYSALADGIIGTLNTRPRLSLVQLLTEFA